MNIRNFIIVIIALAAVLLLVQSIYIVEQTERAVLLRFGAVNRADVPPGLHLKIPVADTVKKFDARVLTLDSAPETYYTLEKKPLIVDSFAKWRVVDVPNYYTRTTGDERRANQLLQQRVNDGLRNAISRRDMHEVISGERDQLMQELTADLNRAMKDDVGIEVIDVRVKRIDLPPEVSTSVYERMNSERAIEARQYRAQGQELALGIRADAERQTVVIEAEAYRESEQIKGDGDASAASIYANAFNKDPEFYEFTRSLNAYAKVFGAKTDLLVLDPNGQFFKYLKGDEEG